MSQPWEPAGRLRARLGVPGPAGLPQRGPHRVASPRPAPGTGEQAEPGSRPERSSDPLLSLCITPHPHLSSCDGSILNLDHLRVVVSAVPHLLRALPALIYLDLDLDSEANPADSLTVLASNPAPLTLKISAWRTMPALVMSSLLAPLRSLRVLDLDGVGLRAKKAAWDGWSSPTPAANASHDQDGGHAPTQGDLTFNPPLCDLGLRWDGSFVSASSLVRVIRPSAHRLRKLLICDTAAKDVLASPGYLLPMLPELVTLQRLAIGVAELGKADLLTVFEAVPSLRRLALSPSAASMLDNNEVVSLVCRAVGRTRGCWMPLVRFDDGFDLTFANYSSGRGECSCLTMAMTVGCLSGNNTGVSSELSIPVATISVFDQIP